MEPRNIYLQTLTLGFTTAKLYIVIVCGNENT